MAERENHYGVGRQRRSVQIDNKQHRNKKHSDCQPPPPPFTPRTHLGVGSERALLVVGHDLDDEAGGTHRPAAVVEQAKGGGLRRDRGPVQEYHREGGDENPNTLEKAGVR